MNKKSGTSKDAADQLVGGIKRKNRKHWSAEEKIRIVLTGLRGEESIVNLSPGVRICKTEGEPQEIYDMNAIICPEHPAFHKLLGVSTDPL